MLDEPGERSLLKPLRDELGPDYDVRYFAGGGR